MTDSNNPTDTIQRSMIVFLVISETFLVFSNLLHKFKSPHCLSIDLEVSDSTAATWSFSFANANAMIMSDSLVSQCQS